MTINNNLISELRSALCACVASARYKTGGSWYTASIGSKTVQDNGAVHITFLAQKQGSATTATEFQLLGASGQVLASQSETITFTEGIDTMQIRFKFGVNIA